jgi:choice-of-anchor C domain-containing protein
LVGSAGGVSQTFSTVAGTQYKVTFDMAGNYANLPTLKPMSVSADGQSQEFTFDVTGRSALNMGWTPMSWLFVADDSSATLQFLSLTTTIQGWGPALDNVSVNPVPVPPAVWLFGSGVLGMIGIARRKKAA